MAALAEEHDIFGKIGRGVFGQVEEDKVPARIPGGGDSFIISYYEGERYIGTVHKIANPDGKIYKGHYHLKRLCLGDVDYRLKE